MNTTNIDGITSAYELRCAIHALDYDDYLACQYAYEQYQIIRALLREEGAMCLPGWLIHWAINKLDVHASLVNQHVSRHADIMSSKLRKESA